MGVLLIITVHTTSVLRVTTGDVRCVVCGVRFRGLNRPGACPWKLHGELVPNCRQLKRYRADGHRPTVSASLPFARKKIIKKRGVCSLVINYVYESTLFIQTGNYFFIIGELNSQPFDHESGVTTGESSLTSSTAPQYDSNTITVT